MFRTTTAPFSLAIALALLAPSATGQDPIPKGYPERDALTPFRNPTDVYAPPDELFRQLRIMQNLANRQDAKKSFGADGREVVDNEAWWRARQKVEEIGLNAGMLAQMMRLHRDGTQRNTAFYAAFYVPSIDDVFELIAHIPGEPLRRTREEAFPRAIAFVRAHLGRRFGDLSTDQQDALRKALPEIGSPVAKARGLVREPQDQDYLHTLRLVPFLQLLDIDDPLDQAQALWFLKETFKVRLDLATLWLEPSLPRIRQLLLDSDSEQVRAEAIGLFEVIGPDGLPAAPKEREALLEWAKLASKHLFPPIRSVNDALIVLYPSEERDAIARAGVAALENSSIGDPFRGQRKDGSWYRGFRVSTVPDELKPLRIPAKSVITAVNGVPIGSAQELIDLVEKLVRRRPCRLFVEYEHKERSHAVEFRIM